MKLLQKNSSIEDSLVFSGHIRSIIEVVTFVIATIVKKASVIGTVEKESEI